MTEEKAKTAPHATRSIELHLALYDHAHEMGSGSYWTWHSPQLPSRFLDTFYYEDLSPEYIEQSFDKRPPLWGGFVGVDDTWCCWYRVIDAGRDTRGRPGRRVVAAAFCLKSEAVDVDAVWALKIEEFERVTKAAPNQLPVTPPPKLVIVGDAHTVRADARLLERLKRDRFLELQSVAELRGAASACAQLPAAERWHLVIRGRKKIELIDVKLRPLAPPEPPPAPLLSSGVARPAVRGPAVPTQTPPRGFKAQLEAALRDPTIQKLVLASLVVGLFLGLAVGLLSSRLRRSVPAVASGAILSATVSPPVAQPGGALKIGWVLNHEMPVQDVRLFLLGSDQSEIEPIDKPPGTLGPYEYRLPGGLPPQAEYAIKIVAVGKGEDRAEFITKFAVQAPDKTPPRVSSATVTPDKISPGELLTIEWRAEDGRGKVDSIVLALKGPEDAINLEPYGGEENGTLTLARLKNNSGNSGRFGWVVPPLPDGKYAVSVVAVDAANNRSTEFLTREFTVTSKTPAPAAESPSEAADTKDARPASDREPDDPGSQPPAPDDEVPAPSDDDTPPAQPREPARPEGPF